MIRGVVHHSRLGVDANGCDEKGHSPPSFAALGGQEAVVRLLLSTPRINLNLKNDNGETPVSLATQKGHQTIVHATFSLASQSSRDVRL
jgi:ankyrin repeat protein